MIEWEKTVRGESEILSQVPEGATIISINDEDVLGKCESCGKYITSLEDLYSSSDDCDFCKSCFEDMEEE